LVSPFRPRRDKDPKGGVNATPSRGPDLLQELRDQELISDEQMEHAQEHAGQEGLPPDQAVIQSGILSEDEFLHFIADRYQLPIVDLTEVPFDDQLISLVPERTAKRYLALPLYKKGHAIVVAMAEPWKVGQVDEVRFSIGRSIRPVLAPRSQLQEKLDELFIQEPQSSENPEELSEEADFLDDALSDLEDAGLVTEEKQHDEEAAQQLFQESSASPIVKIVNDILIRAIHKGASDIHIEPQETNIIVRFRVDGALQEIMNLPAKAQSAIVSRIKVLGGMDISVSRKPQDGRIKIHYRDSPLDLRVSTLPTYWGEKTVMRVLDQSGASLEVEKLGFLRGERDMIRSIMKQPQGMLLVTGPTGSGKTTTLYSILSAINQEDVNIITVEDPVEYQLAKINQVPVNPKAGMTFAAGLRSILRQDPNVIMVGEIRDQETAEIALESAETGHMVFSTLHTNSAAGAVTRFLDMDVPGYLLASSLSGVLAQRLLRRNCPDCSVPVEVGAGLRARYNIPEEVTFYEGQGCATCDGQGTKGRMGVYELLLADREIGDSIHQGATESELVDLARRNGMHLMFEDALIKAMQGHVSMTEVLRGLESPTGVEIDAGHLLDEADKTWRERGLGVPQGGANDTSSGEAESALVVSGEEGHRNVVAMILEGMGLTVERIESGRRALDRIHQAPPALVVADLESPELDGVAIAESVRRESRLRDIPLLVVAEEATVRSETRSLEAGADDFLAKPLDPERLVARSRRLLAIYRRLRQPGKEMAAPDAGHETEAPEPQGSELEDERRGEVGEASAPEDAAISAGEAPVPSVEAEEGAHSPEDPADTESPSQEASPEEGQANGATTQSSNEAGTATATNGGKEKDETSGSAKKGGAKKGGPKRGKGGSGKSGKKGAKASGTAS